MPQGVSYVQAGVVYIRNTLPEEGGLAVFGVPGQSGRGDGLFILLALLSIFEPVLILLAVRHGGAFEGLGAL
jgi:hypothetical protein